MAGHGAGPREVHEPPRDTADHRLSLIENTEDTVEVGRVDQTVATVRIQRTGPSARVAIRALVRLMMAHLDLEALRHVVEPEIELRLNTLTERVAQGELRRLRHVPVHPLDLDHRAYVANLYGIEAGT